MEEGLFELGFKLWIWFQQHAKKDISKEKQTGTEAGRSSMCLSNKVKSEVEGKGGKNWLSPEVRKTYWLLLPYLIPQPPQF